jgi:hypothetical protein
MKEIPVWRFIHADRRLGYGDGREVREGETLSVDGPVKLCENGIHGSERLTDAIGYSENRPALTRARLSGDADEGDDKCCAQHCTTDRIITIEETSKFLRLFAVRCARRVLKFADEQHRATLENTLDVAERYALGDATENDLTTARAAASAAARDAASAAARDAASAAARAAARDIEPCLPVNPMLFGAASAAAWDAASAAAWAASAAAWAASATARAAAWAAARDAAWDAARDAASAAARDAEWAARDEQERIANELWKELFE